MRRVEEREAFFAKVEKQLLAGWGEREFRRCFKLRKIVAHGLNVRTLEAALRGRFREESGRGQRTGNHPRAPEVRDERRADRLHILVTVLNEEGLSHV